METNFALKFFKIVLGKQEKEFYRREEQKKKLSE